MAQNRDHDVQPCCAGRMTLPLAYALLLAASTTDARAAELQQPVPLYAAGLPTEASPDATDPPGSLTTCPATAPLTGLVSPGRLVVRDTDRPDVGPYTVTLPGYAANPVSAASDSYRPFLLGVLPGDTLRLDLVNQLGTSEPLGGAVNLHMHGIITSPRPCTPLGDDIFVAIQPGITASYRIDVPATLPGTMFGNGATPQPYPSGLQWFHAHMHEKTADDLFAGQAGMVYVGDLRADLLATPNLDWASADALSNADVLYMGLRDIQLAVPSGAVPGQAAPGQRAQWLQEADYDPNACLSVANPPVPVPNQFAGPGYCGHHGVTTSGTTDPSQDMVWLHTVNGQHNPTVTLQPGRNQIWRIANLSPNETYLLELVDNATGRAEIMDVLSLDGLAAGTTATDGTGLNVGVQLAHLLLMPASRAEVLVINAGGASGRQMTLRTAGITTGAGGSHWPRIDLAQIAMPPGPQPAAAGSSLTSGMTMTMPMMAPSSVAPSNVPAGAAPANCITLPPGRVTRRRITFADDPASKSYLLGSEVVDVNGVPVDAQHTIAPQPFPMQAMLAPNTIPHVCARLGTQEVWEVVNYTGELHNFHVHEDKFRLTRQTDPGAPSRLQAVQDPGGLITQYEPEAQNAGAIENVDVYHDTFPLPPYGGRIFVTVPFFAPQQVGNFVYHCHILSHEDAGMMAVLEVYDPAQLAAAAAPVKLATLPRNAICGLPPPRAASFSGRLLDAAWSAALSAFGLATDALGRPATRWSGLDSR